MKDRIRQIMESQHMTQQVFAEYIGLSPGSLSGIFNGRTRPTLPIVDAIKKKIPNISTDWLIFGTGDMLVQDQQPDSTSGQDSTATDQSSNGRSNSNSPMLDFAMDYPTAAQNGAPTAHSFNSVKNTRPEIVREEVKYVDKPQRRVVEIRVFYDDQTWDSFVPARK